MIFMAGGQRYLMLVAGVVARPRAHELMAAAAVAVQDDTSQLAVSRWGWSRNQEINKGL